MLIYGSLGGSGQIKEYATREKAPQTHEDIIHSLEFERSGTHVESIAPLHDLECCFPGAHR